MLLFGVGGTILAGLLLNFSPALIAGMFTGTFTVTPALAGVLETLDHSPIPVVGYSLAYPFSIIASMLLLVVFRKLWKIDQHESNSTDTAISSHTIRYTRQKPCKIADIPSRAKANVDISRIYKNGAIMLANPAVKVQQGDLLTVIGSPKDYEAALAWLGEPSVTKELTGDASNISSRRIFISNEKLAGKKLRKLELNEKFDVIITRVRRGDVDILAHRDLALELGDRIRVVGTKENIKKAAEYLGDSYRHSSEMNVLPFALGICMGILVGSIPLPLPSGQTFELGAAGGTILIALLLGAMRRTGPINWQIPYSTNLALRQFGLIIFLAGIGSQAGGAWVKALANPTSYQLMAVSFGLALALVALVIVIGYKFLKIPYSRLSGMIAAFNTQPATLAFANEQTRTDDANLGYAAVYPLALVAKIILAQIILILLIR